MQGFANEHARMVLPERFLKRGAHDGGASLLVHVVNVGR